MNTKTTKWTDTRPADRDEIRRASILGKDAAAQSTDVTNFDPILAAELRALL